MLAPGDRVGVAVSAGADSMCLLHLLQALAPRWNLRLMVLHLNHMLRGDESDGDMELVRQTAVGMGLPFRCETVDVRRIAAERNDNLEQVSRDVRGNFFERCRTEEPLDHIAVGHTRSDQAETVLFRFLRGSGTAGLAAIRP